MLDKYVKEAAKYNDHDAVDDLEVKISVLYDIFGANALQDAMIDTILLKSTVIDSVVSHAGNHRITDQSDFAEQTLELFDNGRRADAYDNMCCSFFEYGSVLEAVFKEFTKLQDKYINEYY